MENIEFLSRKEAKEKGLTKFFSKSVCIHGHCPTERYTSSSLCVECSSVYGKLEKRKEKAKETRKEYKSKPEIKQKLKEYEASRDRTEYRSRPETKSKITEYNNTPKQRERRNKNSKEWRRNNSDKGASYLAWKRASIERRTPSWADKVKIAWFYKEAKRLTEETGVPHEVDHDVPLHGKLVSGLHVETNLRIITAAENRSKNNKFEPA